MKYVTCEIMGGLGNQLFQIFAVIAYAMKHRWVFVFEYKEKITGFTPIRLTHWNNFLKPLKRFTTDNVDNKMISSYLPQFPIYRERSYRYQEISANHNFMFLKLNGYFQSYKYFHQYFDKICELIELNQQIDKVHNDNKELLSDGYNISMHFRVGDYRNMQQHHPIMPYKYYYNCLKYILKIVNDKNIKVIYFCEKDDTDFVNETITKLKLNFTNLEFVKADDSIEDWQQMLLMSCCNSNIIANSSFSWWSAYFNRNPDKIVCYPSVWFGKAASSDHNDLSDLIPNNWKKVNIRD